MQAMTLIIPEFLEKALRSAGEHFVVVVVAAILIILGTYIWHRGLGTLNRFLRAVPVSGRWTTEVDRGKGWQVHEEAQLHQLSNRVWGSTTITSGKRKTYGVSGPISGQMLCLVYRTKDGAGFDAGAVVLEVNPEGNEMEGFEVGYDKVAGSIAPRPYKWTSR